MKKICIAALAATLALGTMITAQAADTTEPTYPKQYRSVNGGRLRANIWRMPSATVFHM